MADARPWFRIPTWRCAALAGCVLALISQLALGATVLPDTSAAEQLAALAAVAMDCAPDTPANDPALPHHHDADAALCPLSVTLALPCVVLSPAPELPRPSSVQVACATLPPQARAPPAKLAGTHYPRGPPILS